MSTYTFIADAWARMFYCNDMLLVIIPLYYTTPYTNLIPITGLLDI